MRLLAESLAALGAAVRAAVCVDALVLQQRRLLLEILATRQALEEPQLAVGVLALLALVLLLLLLLQDVWHAAHVLHVAVEVFSHDGLRAHGSERRQQHARLLEVVHEAGGAHHVRWVPDRVPALRVVVAQVLVMLLLLLLLQIHAGRGRRVVAALHLNVRVVLPGVVRRRQLLLLVGGRPRRPLLRRHRL